MPLYEYQCHGCGQRFETIRKFSDPPLETCTLCGAGPIERLLSSPAIQFKGAGWYITDYARKGQGGDASSGGSDAGGKTSTTTTKATESSTTTTDAGGSSASASTPPAKT